MALTAFLPFFVVLVLWAMRSPQSWLAATGFACFLQGASPIILTAGGRESGLAPGYLLIGIGVFHYLRNSLQYAPRSGRTADRGMSTPQIWLCMFTLIGVVGALLLPRVFSGIAHAMETRGSISAGVAKLVHPSGTNFIQAFYLILNLMLFSIAARMVRTVQGGLESALKGVAAGLLFASLLGLYQLIGYYVGLPWPADIINSNTGVGQFPDQMAGGLKRITSTFWEPSLLGYNFVGCLGIFLLGARKPWLGALALCVLLLSTSSLGYFGLIALLGVWMLVDRQTAANIKWRAVAAVAAICIAFVIVDQVVLDGEVINDMVLNKAASSSGVGRGLANQLAMQTLFESVGLGVGVGSARASSFIATLLATTGLPGTIAFIGFAVSLVVACLRKGDTTALQLGYGLVGFLLVWAIAIPDTIQALFWFVAGLAGGYTYTPAATRAVVTGNAVAWPAK